MRLSFSLISILLLFSSYALSHGGAGNFRNRIEDNFAFMSHTHLPVELGLNGEVHYNIPFVNSDEVNNQLHALEVFIHPLALLGFERVDRVITIDKSYTGDINIESSHDSNKFLQIKSFKWDLGFGGELEPHLASLFSFGVGASFVKGKIYYREMVLNNRFEKRKKIQLPINKSIFERWRIGDKVSFATRHNFYYGLSLGYGVGHFGALIESSGSFFIKYKKVSKSKLVVDIINNKTRGKIIEAKAAVIASAFETSKKKGNGFRFELDMKSDAGIKSFKQIMLGNLIPVQKEAQFGSPHVKELSKYISTSTGSNTYAKFYIPLIFTIQYSKGHEYSIVNNETLTHDESQIIKTSTITKETSSRGMLSKHYLDRVSTRVITIEDAKNGDYHKPLLAGNIVWDYQKDNSNYKKIKSFLAKIANKTGIEKIKSIKVPNKYLGYTRAQLAINLSAKDIFSLLNRMNVKIIQTNALAGLARDFAKFGHKGFCKIKKEIKCFNLYKEFIINIVSSILKFQKEAHSFYKEKQDNLALDSINKIIKSISSSDYLLEAFISNAPNLDIEFAIEGEYVKRSRIDI